MKKKSPQVDHGCFELKWLLRKRLLRQIQPGVAIDLYAGRGRLLPLTSDFSRVYAVEKDPRKWQALSARLSPEDQVRVRTFCLNNREFVRRFLPRLRGVNYLDFDAYGDPKPLIREVFSVWRPAGRTAIAVTDGGRLALCRGFRLRVAEKLVRPSPLLRREYELFVRSFWQDLAQEHHFSLQDFITAWRKGRRVMYYGLIIEPN